MQILGDTLLGRRVGPARFVPQSVSVVRENVMPSIAMWRLVVRDCDETLAFHVGRPAVERSGLVAAFFVGAG